MLCLILWGSLRVSTLNQSLSPKPGSLDQSPDPVANTDKSCVLCQADWSVASGKASAYPFDASAIAHASD